MIVVDSAAVVNALTAVEGSDELRAEIADEDLHAPTLLDFEVVSALRGGATPADAVRRPGDEQVSGR